jgi:hypothetical protein
VKRLFFVAFLALAACGKVVATPSSDAGSGGSPAACMVGTTDDCGACGDVCASEHGSAWCEMGACMIACDAGFADCNGLASDGCEAELASDPENCGACGTSCGEWGECFQGTCATTLVSALGVDGVVTVGDHVYWSALDYYAGDDGSIGSAPLAGGAPTPLMIGQSAPHHLRSNGSVLVWAETSTSSIYAMSTDGGAITTLLVTAAPPRVLDVDANDVWFTTGTEIASVPLAGGAPTTLGSGFVSVSAARRAVGWIYVADLGPEEEQLAADGSSSWGHPHGTIHRIATGSGAAELLASELDTPVALAPTGDALHWVEAGSLTTYFVNDVETNLGTLGRVVRSNLGGGGAAVLADGLVQPNAVEVDATHVYWTSKGTVGGVNPEQFGFTSDGHVARIPHGGGAPEILMPAIDASHLALAEEVVCFASWNYGLVFRVAKP